METQEKGLGYYEIQIEQVTKPAKLAARMLQHLMEKDNPSVNADMVGTFYCDVRQALAAGHQSLQRCVQEADDTVRVMAEYEMLSNGGADEGHVASQLHYLRYSMAGLLTQILGCSFSADVMRVRMAEAEADRKVQRAQKVHEDIRQTLVEDYEATKGSLERQATRENHEEAQADLTPWTVAQVHEHPPEVVGDAHSGGVSCEGA